MNRRSRLSLSPATGHEKKQPPGFVPAAEKRPDRVGAEASYQPQARSEPLSAKTDNGMEAQKGTSISTGTIVKVLLIVGAAALSIFLLKRRLF